MSEGKNSQENETISKGKEMGKKTYNETKEATNQALEAIKILFSDPIGGQSKSLEKLGSSNALKPGIVFISIFMILVFFITYGIMEPLLSYAEMRGRDVNFLVGYIKMFVVSSMIPASILLGYFIISKYISKVSTSLSVSIYTTGISLLPLTIIVISFMIFGMNNFKLLAAIGFFCTSTMVLLVNSSLQSIYKISSRVSFLITPLFILISTYLSWVITLSLLK